MNMEKVIAEKVYTLVGMCKGNGFGWFMAANDIGNEIIALLKEQEEIVRCKDCKNRTDSLRCPLELLKKQLEYTKVFTYSIPDDWFCANGERRDNNA